VEKSGFVRVQNLVFFHDTKFGFVQGTKFGFVYGAKFGLVLGTKFGFQNAELVLIEDAKSGLV
jgi:hypothetical protein